MTFDARRIEELLPAVYRIRDAHEGHPLCALLSIIAEQAAVLEEDLAQLYDDQFIETCAEWVVPYIGDLVGARALHGAAPSVRSARAEVAHTIGYRRRKGTAAALEQLARDATGWEAKAVEFFERLATTQSMNHPRSSNLALADPRRWETREHIGGPFDTTARTIDVRRIPPGEGRHNIPNVGLFLWRLRPHSWTNAPASRLDDRRWLISPLGADTPLFSRPRDRAPSAGPIEPADVPMPISRRLLNRDLALYYGDARSLSVQVRWNDGDDSEPIPVHACDLSNPDWTTAPWAHATETATALDPALGRLAFPPTHPDPAEVRVTFHTGFSADIGGGEYERADSFDHDLTPIARIPDTPSLQPALDPGAGNGVVEITTNDRYTPPSAFHITARTPLELRAANEGRPILLLSGTLLITGEEGENPGATPGEHDAEVTLNGLIITGAPITVPNTPGNTLRRLRLRHCTLLPGLSLNPDGSPAHPGSPSLIIESPGVAVEIDRCILGAVRADPGAELAIADSIIDATSETLPACTAPDGAAAGAPLRITNSTVIGTVHTTLLRLASNTIFLAEAPAPLTPPLRAARRQAGCARFSYIPTGSITPRRFQCRPANDAERHRVRPSFTSLRYAHPGYAQLTPGCPREIRTGADDEGEIGAFHHLHAPQREADLRARLDEYLRVGLEAGIIYAM